MTPEILAQLIGDLDRQRSGTQPSDDPAWPDRAQRAWMAIGPAAIKALARAPAVGRADQPNFPLRLPSGTPVREALDLHDALATLAGGCEAAALLLDADLLRDRPEDALRALQAAAPGALIILWGRPLTKAARAAMDSLELPIWDSEPDQNERVDAVQASNGPPPTAPVPPPAPPPTPPLDRPPVPTPGPGTGAFAEGCLARITRLRALTTYILHTLQNTAGASRASLMLRDPERRTLRLRAVSGMRDDLVGKARQALGAGIAGRVAALGRPTIGRGSAGGPRRYDGAAYVVLPLGRGARCQGVLSLTGLPGDALPTATTVREWQRLCLRAGTALSHARRLRRAEALSTRDTLTGLPNRRAFRRALVRELERARRSGSRLGLAMVDIDHFKRFNDELGHQVGDAALVHVSRRLEAAFRETDLVCRWGGEEFAVLLPGLGPDPTKEARIALERARLAVAGRPLALGSGLPSRRVTVSAGFAVCPAQAGTGDRLIEDADRALRAAKTGGRDRICGSEPE